MLCAGLDMFRWASTAEGWWDSFWEYDSLIEPYTNTPEENVCMQDSIKKTIKLLEEVKE